MYFGSESSLPIVTETMPDQSKKSFMHISMKDSSDEKGKKWTPVWDNGVNFFDHLFSIITPEIQVLETQVGLLRDLFFRFYEIHYMDAVSKALIDNTAPIHGTRETNMLLKKGDNMQEYSFNLSHFLLECNEDDYSMYPELNGLQNHSAFSVKLRILGTCIEEIIETVVWISITNN